MYNCLDVRLVASASEFDEEIFVDFPDDVDMQKGMIDQYSVSKIMKMIYISWAVYTGIFGFVTT